MFIGPTVIQRRQINDKASAQFMKIIGFENTPCVINVLDIISPVKVRMVKNKETWGHEDSVRAQKRESQRAGSL